MIYDNMHKIIADYSNKTKYGYTILEAILRNIDIDLSTYPKTDIKNYVNIFRRKLANDLIQKKKYKDLPNILKLEKNDIYTKLINNEECDENIYKYVSFYIELNIIIIKSDKYRYINEYNNNINSIILVEVIDNKFVPVYSVEETQIYNIFENKDIEKLLEKYILDSRLIFNNKIELTNKEYRQINKLKNYKLSELHNICEIYSINIFKYISDRKLYKKKMELFEEIKLKLINKMI